MRSEPNKKGASYPHRFLPARAGPNKEGQEPVKASRAQQPDPAPSQPPHWATRSSRPPFRSHLSASPTPTTCTCSADLHTTNACMPTHYGVGACASRLQPCPSLCAQDKSSVTSRHGLTVEKPQEQGEHAPYPTRPPTTHTTARYPCVHAHTLSC